MIALLLTVMGALPEPRYVVEKIAITQSEMRWLLEQRIAYEERAAQQVQNIGARVAEVEAEIVALTAERDATQDQAEKDAIDAQIAKIETGTTERGKVGIKRVYSAPRPTAADARRLTVAAVFADGAFLPGIDADGNGTLRRRETGWPAFVFNALDADSNGELTTAEIEAYLGGL